jgi:hypothetical protein
MAFIFSIAWWLCVYAFCWLLFTRIGLPFPLRGNIGCGSAIQTSLIALALHDIS